MAMLTRRATMRILAAAPLTTMSGKVTARACSFDGINGDMVRLSDYEGPIVVVNTASKCLFAEQLRELQSLFHRYRAHGLGVIGVPSPSFGGQEFKSKAEVKAFYEENFQITFGITNITHVLGPSAHPFYVLAGSELGIPSVPRWNFHKYIVDANGNIASAFNHATSPLSPTFLRAVDKAFAA